MGTKRKEIEREREAKVRIKALEEARIAKESKKQKLEPAPKKAEQKLEPTPKKAAPVAALKEVVKKVVGKKKEADKKE